MGGYAPQPHTFLGWLIAQRRRDDVVGRFASWAFHAEGWNIAQSNRERVVSWVTKQVRDPVRREELLAAIPVAFEQWEKEHPPRIKKPVHASSPTKKRARRLHT